MRRDDLDVVTEIPECLRELGGALAYGLRVGAESSFLISNALVQNLPCQPAEPIGDGPDRLVVPKPPDEAPVQSFKNAAFGLDRGVGHLIKDAPHGPVSLGRTIAF